MASGKCNLCGSITNSAVSDWDYVGGAANGCYAKFDEATRTWSKGCVYDKTNYYDKMVADGLIKTQPHKK